MSKAISAARKTAGLSQTAMSKELGIPLRTIQNREGEVNKCPEWAETVGRYSDGISDLIEPYRPFVDIASHDNIGSNIQLSKAERRELAHVLHNACMVEGTKVNIMSALREI